MNRCVIYLIVLLFCSCGSRKVDLQKRITDIEHNLSVKTKELEIERNKLRLYESSRIVKADSVVEKESRRIIYNPRSEEKSIQAEASLDIGKSREEVVNEYLTDNSMELDRQVDRRWFDWMGFIILVVIAILIYMFRSLAKRSGF